MKIRVYNSQTSKLEVIEMSGTTWGDLKKHLKEKGLYNNDMSATIRENRMSLVDDGAVLPTQLADNSIDCSIFLVPNKNKAGIEKPTWYKVSDDFFN